MDDERGILYPARLPSFARLPAPPEVADRVRWFWIPEWDLAPGEVSRQHVIAFPASNLVVEHAGVTLTGPSTRASFRDLVGTGWAVGALLRPAAVPALSDDPRALCDSECTIDAEDLHAGVGAAMLHPPEHRHAHAVAAFSAWLQENIPPATDEGRAANAMADLLDADPTVTTLGDAAEALHASPRTLQRLAARHVGLSPTAMIRRRRLQEAVEELRSDAGADIATVAARLGYTDHAHLANDLRRTLGVTPSHYRRAVSEVPRER